MIFSLRSLFLLLTITGALTALIVRQVHVKSKRPLLFIEQETGMELPFGTSIVHDCHDIGRWRYWKISVPKGHWKRILGQTSRFGQWNNGPVTEPIDAFFMSGLSSQKAGIRYAAMDDAISTAPWSKGRLLVCDSRSFEIWYMKWGYD